MKKLGSFLLLCIFLININLYSNDFSKSIVKIISNYNPWNYETPWQKQSIFMGTGTGCIIDGKKIITNAHIASEAIFIQVQFAGESKKYTAKPIFINNIADLALLEIDDEEFWKKSEPLTFGEIPEVLDDISVYGFSIGGEQMSITRGVVSRVEFGTYAQSYISLLHGQIDAAVNPGNSGGPVMKDGKCVGIVMQSNRSAENTNYFIPTPVIKHFLNDVSDSTMDGIPNDLIYIQMMENEGIRKFYNMNEEQTGVRIVKILNDSPCKGKLKVNDIILALDDINIDNEGMFKFRKNERIDINFILYKKQIGETINYTVLRDGKILEVPVKLTKRIGDGMLVPLYEYNKQPTYFIIGGLLFQPLTYNLNGIYQFGPNILNYFYKESEPDLKEVIILTKILPNSFTSGYNGLSGSVVKKVNNKKIISMKSLIEAFESNDDDFHIIELVNNYKIILDREKLNKLNSTVLKMYGIKRDRSQGIKEE